MFCGESNEDVECEGEVAFGGGNAGERRLGGPRGVELMVVLRTACVVSAEGGGGRFVGMEAGVRMEARQRKHSPVPK